MSFSLSGGAPRGDATAEAGPELPEIDTSVCTNASAFPFGNEKESLIYLFLSSPGCRILGTGQRLQH